MDRARCRHGSLLTLGCQYPDDQRSCRKRPRPGGAGPLGKWPVTRATGRKLYSTRSKVRIAIMSWPICPASYAVVNDEDRRGRKLITTDFRRICAFCPVNEGAAEPS
jgi:hypothetical protein